MHFWDDPLRWSYILTALPLALVCGASVVYAHDGWHQKVRMAALGTFCWVTVRGQLDRIGLDYTSTTYWLGVALALSLLGMTPYVVKAWIDVRAGGRRDAL